MDLYLDVVGVLFPKDRVNKLYNDLKRSGLFPKELEEEIKRLRKENSLDYKKEMMLKEEALKRALLTKEGREFFSEWLKENIPNFEELRESIKLFIKEGNRVFINSKFSEEISSFIAKQLNTNGYVKKKTKKEGFLVDDKLRKFQRKKYVEGIEFGLPTPSYGKVKQSSLEEFGIIITPKNLAELVLDLRHRKLLNVNNKNFKQKTLDFYGLQNSRKLKKKKFKGR